MHIAIVTPEFPPEMGGMQTYAVDFVRELAGRGHRVTVFTRQRSTPAPLLVGVEVRQVMVGRRGPDLRAFRAVQADAWHVMNAAYAWVACEFSPTLVSIHGNDFLRPYIPVGQPDLRQLPLLWRLDFVHHDLAAAIGRWRTPRLMRQGLQRAARILSNSRYTEQVFLQQFPECRGRTSAAMVGVDAEAFAGRPWVPAADGAARLITVCRLSEERKNVGLVLQALARLAPMRRFVYTVVGDGDLRPGLEQQARALGLAGQVRFTGFLSSEDLARELAHSDLFVLTAAINEFSHEGFGIAYLEANACGVPTLAARLAGAAEAVDDGVSGYFTEELSEAGVARALDRFLSGALRFDADACRRFARTFSWAQVVDQALPWYGVGAGAALAVNVTTRA
jgi:glycosyltransferase involved in cell wall biosynthesis